MSTRTGRSSDIRQADPLLRIEQLYRTVQAQVDGLDGIELIAAVIQERLKR